MKFSMYSYRNSNPKRRSREGAWIEIGNPKNLFDQSNGRSREGAWIEMSCICGAAPAPVVAPARERGLKSAAWPSAPQSLSRSREGAWIEIVAHARQP